MIARKRRNVTSHVHNLSCLERFSLLFAIVLHDPWKLEVSREHLSMCCSDVLIEFLPSAIHEYLNAKWQSYRMLHMVGPHLRIPPWRNTKRASVDTLAATYPPVLSVVRPIFTADGFASNATGASGASVDWYVCAFRSSTTHIQGAGWGATSL